MRKATIFIVVALLMTLCAIPVYAVPPLPHAFYGDVTINTLPAPVGTRVEARGEGVLNGIQGNPITTSAEGQYGGSGALDQKLVVQGDILEGAIVTFYVNGVSTGQSYPFDSGETTELTLSVSIAPPSGGGATPTVYVETNLFGTPASLGISETGEIQETVTATSADGNLTMTIPAGTIALDKDGEPLSSMTAAVDPSPPPPPEGANIIGLAYDFGPDGATFDPPLTLEYTYDPADIPEGVAEGDLVLAYYDEAAGEWIELPCTVDPVTHRIIATVSHFTIFAIITRAAPPPAPAAFSISNLTVQPIEVQPKEAVTVAVSVANTGGTEGSYTAVLKINGVKETEKSVTIAAGGSETVTFSVTREDAASYSVTVDGLSSSFTVVAVIAPPAPASFSVSNLSIKPAEVITGEALAISVAVANIGGTEGSYTVVLKINGVKETEKSVTIAAGGSETVTFTVTREDAASYSVTVDGLSGSFTVVATAVVINWPLLGGIIGAVIVVGLLVFFLVRRRAY